MQFKCKLNANFECNANQLATQSDHWTTFSPPGRWCFMYFVNYQVQCAEKPIGYYPTHFQLSALHLQFLRCFKLKVQGPIQRQDLPSTDLPHVQFEFPFSLNGPSAVKPSNEIWAIWMLNTNKSTLAYPPPQSPGNPLPPNAQIFTYFQITTIFHVKLEKWNILVKHLQSIGT